MNKRIEYYLGLPYTIELVPEPEGGWFVAVRELPGCMSEGDTPEEAIEMIRDAMRGWIEVSLEDGDPIPEPRPLEKVHVLDAATIENALWNSLPGGTYDWLLANMLQRKTLQLVVRSARKEKR